MCACVCERLVDEGQKICAVTTRGKTQIICYTGRQDVYNVVEDDKVDQPDAVSISLTTATVNRYLRRSSTAVVWS